MPAAHTFVPAGPPLKSLPWHADVQDGPSDRAAIQLCIVPSLPQLEGQPNAAEGYRLQVSAEQGIRITALTRAGLFYGVQSALQLLPPTPLPVESSDSGISVPAVLVRYLLYLLNGTCT